jgi:hypothetical protein
MVLAALAGHLLIFRALAAQRRGDPHESTRAYVN